MASLYWDIDCCLTIYIFFFTDEKWKDNIRLLGETMRLSYGAGVVLRMGGIARLELNYCVPVKVMQGDRSVYFLICILYHLGFITIEMKWKLVLHLS